MAASASEIPTREEPTTVVLEGVVGSTAYGLAHEESDVDRLGVFIEPTINFLGLDGVPTRRESWKQPGDEDRTLHEVGKFLSKALGGNPTFTELLWLPERLYVTKSAIGVGLIGIRNELLAARPVRDSYLGYATQQFGKLEERGGSFSSDTRKRTEKHARHMARLLLQGLHAWLTGIIMVDLAEMGRRYEFYQAIVIEALGWTPDPEVDGDAVVGLPNLVKLFGEQVAGGDIRAAHALMRLVEVRMDEARTPLPDQPDRKAVDSWLKRQRLDQLKW